jgi:hypothetical protein
MINKCANNITDTKCQNFYNNIEQYIIPNYSLANNLAIVDGQYSDWSSYEQWTEDSCGRQAKRSTRNYISEENGGIPITNPDLVRYQDEYCIADAALDNAWRLTSCKNSFPSELNREELKYYTGYLQDKFSKWMTHSNSTVSKQCFDYKITNGTTIKKGQRVYSPSNTYYLIYQSDGNVCLNNSSGTPLWCAQTQTSSSTHLTFTDGNLILYNGSSIVWQTGSNSDTNSYLEVNDSGRLYIKNSNDRYVLYYGVKHTEFTPGTIIMKSPNGDAYGSFKLYGSNAFFTYQPDGNLVLYDNNKNPIWASGTGGYTHTHLHMQTDGNLVLYNGSSAVWHSNTSINYQLSLKIHDKYLLLVYGAYQILKIINYDKSIGDTEMSFHFSYHYLYPKAPNFVVRNYRGDVWKFPDNYYNSGNPSDPVGGTWRTGSEDPTDVMVNGKSWDYNNSLFTSWMKDVNTTSFNVGNTSINVNNNDDANFRWGRRKNNGMAQYDRIIDCTITGYNPKSHRPGLWDPIAGTKPEPYIIAWYSGSGNKCPCYPLFQKKSQHEFSVDHKGRDYIVNYMRTNPDNAYYDAILRYIGATGIYTMAGLFRSSFTNKDMFINRRKEGLDDLTICNLENIFNDNNCNSDLNKAYKDYLTSMDKYCNNEKNMLSNDCISYFNTSFIDDNGMEIVPNKLKKGTLEKKYISKCRDKKCEDLCNENLGLRFNKEVCIKADLEDKKAAQEAADLKAAEEKAAEELKNKIILIILFIVLVILVGMYFFKKKKSDQPKKRRPARQEQSEEEEPRPPRLRRQNAIRQGMR